MEELLWKSKVDFVEIYKDGFNDLVFCDTITDETVEIIPEDRKEVADAIYKDLGLGWKKYIPGESEPEKSGWYYTTIENENGLCLAYGLWTPETGFTDSGGWEIQDVVHAFRLPFELYQPEDSHDIV